MNTRTIARVLILSLVLLIPLGIWVAPGIVAGIVAFIAALSPLWLPAILVVAVIPLWITYVRSQYAMHIPYVVLELKPGPDTPKTARAMELVFYSLYHRTKLTWNAEYVQGVVRLPWSFDITATEGTVRFFLRIPKSHRQSVEMRLRSEYRDIDLDEVEDYAREVGFESNHMRARIREYKLTKADPYPLKTYEMYEEKTDTQPLDKVLEKLVGIGEGEHLFISFMIRPHQRARKKPWEEAYDSLHQDAHDEITTLLGSSRNTSDADEETQGTIHAIEDALKKPSFDCGVRAVYLADNDVYQETRAHLLETLFDVFEVEGRNGLAAFEPIENVAWPLSDILTAIPYGQEMFFYHLYRRRGYFAPPYYGDPFVLNTAELATLFHLPRVRRSSPLARAQGVRLEPPDNLPVEATA